MPLIVDIQVDNPPQLSAALIDELTAAIPPVDAVTLRQFLPAVYEDLRRVAAGFLREERSDHTLQPTALVHEAYLRMVNQQKITWRNQAQLLGVFARMMRRILIDHANARGAAKRGGPDAVRITLDDSLEFEAGHEVGLLGLDEALRRLEKLDPMQEKIVEMRFFAGLNTDEIGEVLGISGRTVKREWAVAKRWLQRELSRAA